MCICLSPGQPRERTCLHWSSRSTSSASLVSRPRLAASFSTRPKYFRRQSGKLNTYSTAIQLSVFQPNSGFLRKNVRKPHFCFFGDCADVGGGFFEIEQMIFSHIRTCLELILKNRTVIWKTSFKTLHTYIMFHISVWPSISFRKPVRHTFIP